MQCNVLYGTICYQGTTVQCPPVPGVLCPLPCALSLRAPSPAPRAPGAPCAFALCPLPFLPATVTLSVAPGRRSRHHTAAVHTVVRAEYCRAVRSALRTVHRTGTGMVPGDLPRTLVPGTRSRSSCCTQYPVYCTLYRCRYTRR